MKNLGYIAFAVSKFVQIFKMNDTFIIKKSCVFDMQWWSFNLTKKNTFSQLEIFSKVNFLMLYFVFYNWQIFVGYRVEKPIKHYLKRMSNFFTKMYIHLWVFRFFCRNFFRLTLKGSRQDDKVQISFVYHQTEGIFF